MENEYLIALGRMESKIDMLLQYREEQMQRMDVLEARISKLEAWRWTVIGGASVIGSLASYIIHKVVA